MHNSDFALKMGWKTENFTCTNFTCTCACVHALIRTLAELPMWGGLTHFAAFVTLDLVVKVHAMYEEGRGLDSRASTFPNFFCRGICRAEVNLCCLSLIVTLWVGILFLLSYNDIQLTYVPSNQSPVCVYMFLNRLCMTLFPIRPLTHLSLFPNNLIIVFYKNMYGVHADSKVVFFILMFYTCIPLLSHNYIKHQLDLAFRACQNNREMISFTIKFVYQYLCVSSSWMTVTLYHINKWCLFLVCWFPGRSWEWNNITIGRSSKKQNFYKKFRGRISSNVARIYLDSCKDFCESLYRFSIQF